MSDKPVMHCGQRMVCVEGGGFRSYACVVCDHTEMDPPIGDGRDDDST